MDPSFAIRILNLPRSSEGDVRRLLKVFGPLRGLVIQKNEKTRSFTADVGFEKAGMAEVANLVLPGRVVGKNTIDVEGTGPSFVPSRNLGDPLDPAIARMDEVNRTIYVGNLTKSVGVQQILDFFKVCGPLAYIRIAGEDSPDATKGRHAFVEFEDQHAARRALALSGVTLGDRGIQVNRANNAITKPKSKNSTEVLRCLRAKVSALEERLASEEREDDSPAAQKRRREEDMLSGKRARTGDE